MLKNFFRVFFSWFSHVWIHCVCSTRFPCYFITVVTIVFQCGIKSVFAIEGNERPEFSGSRFYPGDGLSEPNKNLFSPICGSGVQTFKVTQNGGPKSISSRSVGVKAVDINFTKNAEQSGNYNKRPCCKIIDIFIHSIIGLVSAGIPLSVTFIKSKKHNKY